MSRVTDRERTLASIPIQILALLLICGLCTEQTAVAEGLQDQTSAQLATSSDSAAHTITAPAGTMIPLTLISPIKSKSTKVGDSVRAVVAFPITIGTRVAIPAGTYVEGTVTSLVPSSKKTRQPDVKIHFTRLLYANGYTASLDAANTEARNEIPNAASPAVLSDVSGMSGYGAGRTRTAFYGGEGFTSHAQSPKASTQTLQEPAPVGPSVAKAMGITFGIFAAVIVTGIIFGRHHRGEADYLLFDAGWQFQMTLTSPLTVDGGQVAAAAASSH